LALALRRCLRSDFDLAHSRQFEVAADRTCPQSVRTVCIPKAEP